MRSLAAARHLASGRWRVSVVALCVTVAARRHGAAPASDDAASLFVRAVDATDPASVAVGFVYTGGGDVGERHAHRRTASRSHAVGADAAARQHADGDRVRLRHVRRRWTRPARWRRPRTRPSSGSRGSNAAEQAADAVRRLLRRRDRRAAPGLHDRRQPRHRRHRPGRPGERRGRRDKTALWSAIRQAGNGARRARRGQAEPVRHRRPGRQRQRRRRVGRIGRGRQRLGGGVRRRLHRRRHRATPALSRSSTTNGGQLATSADGTAAGPDRRAR